MTGIGKSSGKAKSRKGKSGGGNMHKHIDSRRIRDDIAAFEKSGGKVEKLGVTRVLQRIAPPAEGEVASSAPSAPSGRKRQAKPE